MSKIFLKFSSFVFLATMFLAAYPIEAQRKTTTSTKPKATAKPKTSSKKPVASKATTNTQQPAKEVATASTPPITINRTVQNLLTRIETNTAIYRRELTRALIQNNLNGTDVESSINAYVSDFENAERALKSRVDSGTDSVADAQDVLNRADFIQGFMLDNDLSPVAQSQWKILRDNLVTLANSYNVSWNINTVPNRANQSNIANNRQPVQNNQSPNSNNRQQPNNSQRNNSYANPRFDTMLTGTYRLNASQSDDVSEVLNRALGINNNQNSAVQIDRMRRNLERRLSAPDLLVIEKRNDLVTIASNLSPQADFTADNVERTEVNQNGRTISVKAAALSNVMEISYQGDRANDFFMTFLPVDNGQLRVTRRLYIENRDQTVTVTSVYDKILTTADFSTVRNIQNSAGTQNNPNYPNNTNNANSTINSNISNDFIVPNGTQLIGVLNSIVSTQNAREGDRFTMEVSQPSQLAGAVIEGYVSNTQQSTRVANTAQVTFTFDKITLRNGTAYRFNGMIDAIRLPSGEMVRVINQNNTASTRQPQRGGVGGTLGAIFGAILTGNAGQNQPDDNINYGSGTIVLQGQTNIELQSGSEFRIISSSPTRPATGN